MKSLILFALTFFSVSSYALTDAEFDVILNTAMVKADLYFCFKGASGATVSGDKVVDSLIMSRCDEKLQEAKKLNITDEEIENIAKRVLEENTKTDADIEFEKAVESALNH